MAEQLFITEFDDVHLPIQYHFSHNVAVRLYDELVWIMKDSNTQKKAAINLDFSEGDNIPKKDEKDIIKWLLKNDRKKDADNITARHLLFAIVSDICHFIYQALDSSKNIKMTVAFSLIRKPFLENLLIIEQLLSSEASFLSKFDASPETYDPGKITTEEKKDLIKNCVSKIGGTYLLDPDIIFELRFDKQNPNSFYAISNLATHLVTTRYSKFKTESYNFNFIFSSYDEWESQLDYFYYFLPYMLNYVVDIVDTYLLEKKIISIKTYKKRKFYRLLAMMLQFDQRELNSRKGKSSVNKIVRTIKIKCKSCNKINLIYKSDIFSLINNKYVLCKHCLVDIYEENKSFDELISKLIQMNTNNIQRK